MNSRVVSSLRANPSSPRVPLAAIIGSLFFLTSLALADPPPEATLPKVFCFRFTDIVDVKTDPSGNTFDFEFEVLNWTNQAATGVGIGLTVSSDVSFGGGRTDFDGRRLNGPSDPPPGNIPTTTLYGASGNTWSPNVNTPTAIQWQAPALGPDLENFSILGPPGPNTPPWLNPASLETIDNGFNVMDGFVLRVSDFNPGESLSFNWFLLDAMGQPFSLNAASNNTYGFGVLNIARVDNGMTSGALFQGNQGFLQSLVEFAPRDSSDPNGPLVNIVPDPAEFAAEFGGGITAPFLNPADAALFGNPTVNTSPIPEPATVYAAALLVGFCSLRWLKSRRGRSNV